MTEFNTLITLRFTFSLLSLWLDSTSKTKMIDATMTSWLAAAGS